MQLFTYQFFAFVLATAICLSGGPTSAYAQPVPSPQDTAPPAEQPSPSPPSDPRSDSNSGSDSPSPNDDESAFEDFVRTALAPAPDGLTADAAAQAALAASPEVAVRRHEVSATRARHQQTLFRYLPQLTTSAEVTRASANDVSFDAGGFTVGALNQGPIVVGQCPADSGGGDNCVLDSAGSSVEAVSAPAFDSPRNNYRVDVQLSVPLSDYVLSLNPARRARRNEVTSAIDNVSAEKARVDLDARIAYYEWLRTVAQLAVAQRSLASSEARLADARLGLDGGTLTPADVLQIESTVASAQVAVQGAESGEILARHNLAVMMASPHINFVVGDDVLAPIESLEAHGTLEDLIAHGQRERAEVRALVSFLEASDAALDGLNGDSWPRLDGVANFTYANPNPQVFPPTAEWSSSWSLGLRLSWSLSRYLDNYAQKNQLRASYRGNTSQLESLQRAIALEITVAFQEWKRAAAALVLNQTALAAAEAAYNERVVLFRAGEATSTAIVEAEVQRHNATLLDVGSRIDVRIARAQLLRAAAKQPSQAAPPSALGTASPPTSQSISQSAFEPRSGPTARIIP